MQVIYEMMLLKTRVKELKSANEALNKRWRAKKSRIKAGGPLNIYDAIDIITEKDVQEQLIEEIRVGSGRPRRTPAGPRHCNTYNKIGHNACTCQENVEMDEELDSE
jgi:hypothetical protein